MTLGVALAYGAMLAVFSLIGIVVALRDNRRQRARRSNTPNE